MKISKILWMIVAACSVFSSCREKRDSPSGDGSIKPDKVPHRSSLRPSNSSNEADSSEKKSTQRGLLDLKELMADGELSPQEMDIYVRSFPDGKDPIKYWNFLRGIPLSDVQKSIYYTSVMAMMGSKGMVDEARTLIDESFGSGKLRSNLLNRLYSESNLSVSSLISVAKSMSSSDDRQALLNSIALKARRLDNLEAVDWSDCGKLQSEFASAVAQGFATKIGEVNGHENAVIALGNGLAAVDRLVRSGQAGVAMVSSFLKEASKYAPFDSWEVLQSREGQFNQTMRDNMEWGIATAMAGKDPAKAMSLIAKEGVNPEAVSQVAIMWLQQDNRASSEWIASNWENLPVPQADAIAIANVRYDLSNGDRESAEKWIALAHGEDTHTKIQALLDSPAK